MNKKTLVIICASIIVLATCFLLYAKHLSSGVLDAFGVMSEKFEKSNVSTQNELDSLRLQLNTSINTYKLKEFDSLSSNLNEYIEKVKQELLSKIDDPTDYSKMDKSLVGDAYFFLDDGYSIEGQEFMQEIENYKKDVKKFFEKDYPESMKNLNEKFDHHNGVSDWLGYNFKDFPLVAILTKLTSFQADIKQINKELLLEMLSQTKK